MAYDVQLVSATPSHLTVKLGNLSDPANQYDDFWFKLSTETTWTKTGPTTSTSYDSPSVTLFVGSSNCTVNVQARYYRYGTYNSRSADLTTAKQPPPSMSSGTSTSSSLSMSWTSVTGASYYRLINRTTAETITVYDTSYTWSGLSPSTSYTFAVYAWIDGN